ALHSSPTRRSSDLIQTWQHTVEQTLRREAAGRRGEAVRRVMDERAAAVPGGDSASEETTNEIPVVVDSDDDSAAQAVDAVSEDSASAVAARVGPIDEVRVAVDDVGDDADAD